MDNNKTFRLTLVTVIISLIILTFLNCNNSKTMQVEYKKAYFKINSISFISRELLTLEEAICIDNQILAIDSNYNIWRLKLNGNNLEEKIINNGIGPDETYKARNLRICNETCWVNSYSTLDKLFYFNITENKPKVHWFRLPPDITVMDSLFPLNDNKVACVYSGLSWEDNLVKIIDKEKGTVAKAGKHTLIKAMQRFNVNTADIYVYKKNAYVTQCIEPIVQVFSLEPLKQIDRIKLSPPFFVPVPGQYDVPKNNHKAHLEWMASWTRVYQMFIDNDWLLIRYIKGYNVTYYYELINLVDLYKRYYIDATQEYIISFKVVDGKFMVMSYEVNEEEIRWKKGEIVL